MGTSSLSNLSVGESPASSKLKGKDKKHQNLLNSVDYILSGSEDALIRGVLTGKYVVHGVKFFARHPLHAMRLMKATLFSNSFTEEQFRQRLLESNTLWSFIKRSAEKGHIEPMLRVMQKYKINPALFDEGQILAPDVAPHLEGILKNDNNLRLIKSAVLESSKPQPNMLAVSSNLLEVVASPPAQHYVRHKTEAIGRFINNAANAITVGDVKRTLENVQSAHPQLARMLASRPKLKEQVISIMEERYSGGKSEDELIAALSKLKEFKDITFSLRPWVQDIHNQITPALKTTLETYHLKPNQLQDPAIFARHAKEFKSILDNLMEVSPSRKVIGPLTEKNSREADKKAQDNMLKLASKILAPLKERTFRQFVQDNPQFVTGNLYDLLKTNETIQEMMTQYDLKETHLRNLLEIVPHILTKNPEKLDHMLGLFASGKFTAIGKQALDFAGQDNEFKTYLDKNQALFSNLLGKVLQTGQIKGAPGMEVASIVPKFLAHPEELKNIIEGYEQGDSKKIFAGILEVSKDPEIKKYFKNHIQLFAEVGAGVSIQDRLVSTFPDLAKAEHAEYLAKISTAYVKGDLSGTILSIVDTITAIPEMKSYLQANSGAVTETLKNFITSSPSIQSALHGMDPSKLLEAAIKNPEGVKTFIQAGSAPSSLALAAVTNPGITWQAIGELRHLFDGSTKAQLLALEHKNNADKQKITDVLLNIEQGPALRKFSDALNIPGGLSQEQIASIEKYEGDKSIFNGIIIKDKSFTNLQIEDMRFVNSTLQDVSFEKSVLTNVAFNGARLENISFRGATIDGATLKSMEPFSAHKNFSLAQAKIVGDISGVDLSGVNLQNADLTGVTSMRDVNFNNTNLIDTKLPHNSEIYYKAYNIDKAITYDKSNLNIDQDLLARINKVEQERAIDYQKEYLAEVTVSNISTRLQALRGAGMSDNQQQSMKGLISGDDNVGKYLRDSLKHNPGDIINRNFKLVSGPTGPTSRILDTLYDHANDSISQTKQALALDMVLSTVSDLKTGLGNAKDIVKQAVTAFSASNPNLDIASLDYKKVTQNIQAAITASKNPREATDRVHSVLSESLHGVGLNSKEESTIRDMAQEIGKRLKVSSQDIELIRAQLMSAFTDLKEPYGNKDISELINKKKDELIGDTKAAESLTKLYYDKSSYTSLGAIWSGAVYLTNDHKTPEFGAKVGSMIRERMQSDLQEVRAERNLESSPRSSQNIEKLQQASRKIMRQYPILSTLRDEAQESLVSPVLTGREKKSSLSRGGDEARRIISRAPTGSSEA